MSIKIQLLVESLLKYRGTGQNATKLANLTKARTIITQNLPSFLAEEFLLDNLTHNSLLLSCYTNAFKYYLTQNKINILNQLKKQQLFYQDIKIKIIAAAKPVIVKKLPKAMPPSDYSRQVMLTTANTIADPDLAAALRNLALMQIKNSTKES